MELKEFIKTVILDIVNAVEEVKDQLNDPERVCPVIAPAFIAPFKAQYHITNNYYYQQLSFDVAVTAENKDGGGAKAGIKVMGLEASLGGETAIYNSTVSRINFHIPISLSAKRQDLK